MPGTLTRDHVVWAYRILLDREPENDAVVSAKLKAYHSTQLLRADIVTSREYADKNRDFAHSNTRSIVIKELDSGLRLFVDLSDHAIGLPIIRDNFERSELAFMRRHLRAGDHALDIGAHIGYFAVEMTCTVGPDGTVNAFEPLEENAALLERSIAENGLARRLHLHRAAVSQVSGTVGLTYATETLNSGGAFVLNSAAPPGHERRSVRAIALDDLDLPRPISFIKMDVEGAEPLVLAGAARLLATDRPVILSELHAGQLQRVAGISPEAFLDLARQLGYRPCRIHEGQAGEELTVAPAEPICSLAFMPEGRPRR
jgi:FkbM family methyltransferase